MRLSTIKECWEIILQKDAQVLEDCRGPLVNLNDCLAHFQLAPLPPLRFDPCPVDDLNAMEPSFANLSEGILLTLRRGVYTNTDLDLAARWAEKLMRFCEVRSSTLRQRTIEKWGDLSVGRLYLLHLSSFLLDYGIFTKDGRFLNTVLKLADRKWIINGKTIKRDLKKENEIVIGALFQFRIILMTEYLIHQLRKGKNANE